MEENMTDTTDVDRQFDLGDDYSAKGFAAIRDGREEEGREWYRRAVAAYEDALAVAPPEDPILLWKGVAPGEKGVIAPEKVVKGGKDGIARTSNVSAPTLQLFPAPEGKRNGAAVLVCPGGGYSILASEHEGTDVCKWLNANGVAGVLLKYRVPRRKNLAKHHAPLQDAQRAMSMIRNLIRRRLKTRRKRSCSASKRRVSAVGWIRCLQNSRGSPVHKSGDGSTPDA